MLSTKIYAAALVLFLTCSVLLLLTTSPAESVPSSFLSSEPVSQLIAPEFDEKRMTLQELGNHGWSLLHTTAAYFPAHVTDQQLQDAYRYLHHWGQFFPCRACGYHFLKMLDDDPPVFKNREEFMQYLCRLHNKVNQHLKKDEFDCSIANLKDRWGGDADCACEEADVPDSAKP